MGDRRHRGRCRRVGALVAVAVVGLGGAAGMEGTLTLE
jgi:hypothetical protein